VERTRDKGAYREREAGLQEKESGDYKREKREDKREKREDKRGRGETTPEGKKPGLKRAKFCQCLHCDFKRLLVV